MGQAERFARIRSCGSCEHMLDGFHRQTGEVTGSRPFAKRCGCWRACDGCLARRRSKLGEDVTRQREAALAARGLQVSSRYAGPEGRWGERLITLTVPHGESPAQDTRALRKAWEELSRRLFAHLRIDRGASKNVMPVWVRSIEVAPGDTGGHAHLHIWWVGPFIDHAWLRCTFGRVLESQGITVPKKAWNEVFHRPPSSDPKRDPRYARYDRKTRTGWHGAIDARAQVWCATRRGHNGRAASEVEWPVVDIRAARDVGAAEYANKVGVHLYVTKGHKGVLARLHPVHAASVYEALEGARATQWARGWAPQKEESEHVWRMRMMRDAERRAFSNEGGVPRWNDARPVVARLRAVVVHEAHAPPGAQLVMPF